MFQGEIIRVSTGPTRNHVIAAVVATVLSVVIHVAFMAYLPRIEFELPFATPSDRARPDFRALHLRDVERPDTSVAPDVPAPEPAKTRLELAKIVEELGLAPDKVLMEPPAVTDEGLAAEDAPAVEAMPIEEVETWEPRQEILSIDAERAQAPLLAGGRARIPRLERVVRAADIVVPVNTDRARIADAAVRRMPAMPVRPEVAQIEMQQAEIGGEQVAEPEPVVIGETAAESAGEVMTEARADITEYRPIEEVLRARVQTYSTLRDFRHGYFQVEIERTGPLALPVIPKDIVFVQDCSASMSEQRLYFCRQALLDALSRIGPDDRFNLVAFRDRAVFCFPEWVANTAEARSRASVFIRGLTAGGNTDIYGSLSELMRLERTPGRPVVATLISDGLPTQGIVDSSDIIGEFTRLNDGRISVFTIGMAITANSYLLDLLSYCNRGDASIVDGGRWGIPEHVQARVASVGRPVLSDVRFRFADADEVEVYPRLTSNLYLDKSLMLYGRYPRGRKDLVFQAVGQALGTKCDMIFSLVLDDATRTKDKGLREMWARQKLYHLIGQYARTPTPEIFEQIRDTSRSYGVRIPHRKKL